jgi:hypothetical protein
MEHSPTFCHEMAHLILINMHEGNTYILTFHSWTNQGLGRLKNLPRDTGSRSSGEGSVFMHHWDSYCLPYYLWIRKTAAFPVGEIFNTHMHQCENYCTEQGPTQSKLHEVLKFVFWVQHLPELPCLPFYVSPISVLCNLASRSKLFFYCYRFF